MRTERHKCKRANDPNADEEGMREYSYLKCTHCNNEDIEVASDNVYKQKYTVIRDHMTVCPSFTGERPAKRGKTTATTSTTTSTAMVVTPVKTTELAELEYKMATLKQKMADSEKKMADSEKKKEEMKRKSEKKNEEMKREDEEMKRKIDGLEDKMSRYDDIIMSMTEQPNKIDQATQTPNEWEKPNTTSPFFSRFATRLQDENSKLRAQLRDLQQQLDSAGVLV